MTMPSECLEHLVDTALLYKASHDRANKAVVHGRELLNGNWSGNNLTQLVLDLDEGLVLLALNARRALQLREEFSSRQSGGKKRESPDKASPDETQDLGMVLNKIVHHVWLHPHHTEPHLGISACTVECDRNRFARFDVAALCEAYDARLKELN